MSTNGSIHALALATVTVATACQFDDPCGKDPYEYKRGLCFPIPDAGKDEDASTDEDQKDSGPEEEGGATGAAQYCKASCDLIGSCLADGNFGTFLEPQLAMIGFEGTDRAGCVTFCEGHTAGEGDAEALECMSDAESKAMCTADDFTDSVTATNECCKGHADSEYCVALCSALRTQEVAYTNVAETCDEVLE
jgi:hypothetical protein